MARLRRCSQHRLIRTQCRDSSGRQRDLQNGSVTNETKQQQPDVANIEDKEAKGAGKGKSTHLLRGKNRRYEAQAASTGTRSDWCRTPPRFIRTEARACFKHSHLERHFKTAVLLILCAVTRLYVLMFICVDESVHWHYSGSPSTDCSVNVAPAKEIVRLTGHDQFP